MIFTFQVNRVWSAVKLWANSPPVVLRVQGGYKYRNTNPRSLNTVNVVRNCIGRKVCCSSLNQFTIVTVSPSVTNTTVLPSVTYTTVLPSLTNTTVLPSVTNTTVLPSVTNTTVLPVLLMLQYYQVLLILQYYQVLLILQYYQVLLIPQYYQVLVIPHCKPMLFKHVGQCASELQLRKMRCTSLNHDVTMRVQLHERIC